MKNLQQKHKEWCEKNFGGMEPKIHGMNVVDAIEYVRAVGEISHHTLKAYQGVRGEISTHAAKRFVSMKKLIARLGAMLCQSFWDAGDCGVIVRFDPAHLAILGISEEVGELCHAGTNEDQIDAVGDIVLYLLDYCNKVGIDFEDAVRTTAEKVHARDWVSNPLNGEVAQKRGVPFFAPAIVELNMLRKLQREYGNGEVE